MQVVEKCTRLHQKSIGKKDAHEKCNMCPAPLLLRPIHFFGEDKAKM